MGIWAGIIFPNCIIDGVFRVLTDSPEEVHMKTKLLRFALAFGFGGACLALRKALYAQAEDLLREPKRREEMIRALNAMAVPDAGEKIYQTLLGLMK